MKIRALIFSVVAVPLVGLAVFYLTKGLRSAPLEVLGEVPEFQLTERSGKPLKLDDLTGKVWVANFIFTHCGEQCPMVNAQMEKLQKRFHHKDNLRLVTFTVDPDRDSPATLSEYAKRLGADPDKWLFLTGKRKDMESLVEKGFKLSSGSPDERGTSSMTHSLNLVLVDRLHRIRGYYDGMDNTAVRHLVADVKRLLRDRSVSIDFQY